MVSPDASALKVTALTPWYGSNRMLAHVVGEEMGIVDWLGVTCAGGMSELAHLRARTILVNDLHRHAINLARVAADPELGPVLYRRLRRKLFHPDELAEAQRRCLVREQRAEIAGNLFGDRKVIANDAPDLEWAVDYFVASWMARSASAGTDSEFRGGLPVRWDAGGGDSAVRYFSAAWSLSAWRQIFRRCTFVCEDCFDFLAKCKDRERHGIYCDAPWPDAGDSYRHKFDVAAQRRLAEVLGGFTQARVVVRFGDHPLIRELYPERRWTWRTLTGRTQSNGVSSDVLILNGPSKSSTTRVGR